MNRPLRQIRRVAAVWLSLAVVACSPDSPLTAPEPTFDASVTSLESGPTPLVCQMRRERSATMRIGPLGGSVNVGGTRMVVPAGAVAEPTDFVLTLPASSTLELDISAAGHEHFRFARPVTVTVSYAHCKSDAALAEQLSAWYVDSESGAFLQDMGAIDSKRAKALTFETDHLSGYAIAW